MGPLCIGTCPIWVSTYTVCFVACQRIRDKASMTKTEMCLYVTVGLIENMHTCPGGPGRLLYSDEIMLLAIRPM